MGAVYEAVHEQIGKHVAVKFLSSEQLADDRAVARFQREAQAAAAIGHPGIIDVYDIGVAQDGAHFLVMECLEGQALSAYLKARGKIDLATTAYIASQVLSALDAAHGKGIVHRDLKPDNVFLEDVGRDVPEVKLLDFGISKILDNTLAEERITATGAVLGTPFYMSPEQARGSKSLDQRIDIYAMGVILYECLTGRLPYPGTTYNEVLFKILTADLAPPSTLVPEVPPRVDGIVARSLARERDDRYESAESLLADLLPFVDKRLAGNISMSSALRASADRPSTAATMLPEEPTRDAGTADTLATGEELGQAGREAPTPASASAPAPPPRRRSWLLPAIAGIMALVALGLGFLVFHFARGESGEPTVPVANVVPLDTGRGVDPAAPDGPTAAPSVVVDSGPARGPEGGAPAADGTSSSIRLSIEVEPSDARVYLDESAVPELPFVGRFQRDELTHRIRVEAPGFETSSQLVSFDSDREVRVVLRRRGPRRPPAEPSGASASEPTKTPPPTPPRDDPWRDGQGAARPGPRGPRGDPWRD